MIEDARIVLLRAKEAGVTTIINVGTSIDASRQSIEFANNTDLVDVYATAGIHAQDGKNEVQKFGSNYIKELGRVARSSNKVVGIGECGFDFYLPGEKRIVTVDKDKEFQTKLFEAQIELAKELDLPLVIHCRNAWNETFELIEKYKPRGLFHSWTGTVELAKKALDLGFYISFSGILTFKNAGQIPEVAKMVPDDRILVETDSPFLSPVPLRGKTNEPKNVKITAQFLANLRGIPFDEISGITTDNAKRLFGLT